ncbi:D-lactate dehydrogenase [Suttonella sp. R2A3]|uniref:D-lactate dehydrogenase n=1 Tax=Suttonella sp. R2A3 TaxID=2908648 RepID=UPI001F24B780|nr:D-lactate dehydrogenase [Suttonella sp. R2A3]UJF23956.1 D-lactate dehydrogenase [Suttonella sp. R2A3]
MTHAIIQDARAIVGDKHVLTDPAKTAKYCKGFRFGIGSALAVIQPGSLLEMWQIAKACVAHDVIILAQAANTGLTGGSTPFGDYDRPLVILSTVRLKGIQLINDAKQAIALPGASLFELEDVLEAHGREPHSVIGSSCIGASIVGGICNNSGGALVRRGPAYTEMALYAQLDEHGELKLYNHLGLDLGDDPEVILQRLEQGDYRAEDVQQLAKKASDADYGARVRDVDADTPSRFNNDGRRLYEASGSAGRLLVFAVRIDTFSKPPREQVLYIGTNDTTHLTDIRRHILQHFDELPVSGEYLHRDYFNVSERYGRDTFLVIDKLGTKYIPRFFAMKNAVDRFCGKFTFMPKYISDRVMQWTTDILPSHLPKIMREYRDRYEHHLILKMADDGIDQAKAFLDDYFKDREGGYHACTNKEGDAAILHRFAAAGAAKRFHAMKHKKVGAILALDIALRRNEEQWFETLPEEIDALVEDKLYCGHFFCHVMHQDYILKKGVDAEQLKDQLLAFFDARGAQYPAEHNVGHLYYAKADLKAFYKHNDPTNSLNPGIGKTAKLKYWADEVVAQVDEH